MSDKRPSSQRPYREVTFLSMALAIVIGVTMNAAITYAGLKIGFTIGGSAIAAVLGFGVLRGLLRKGTILETNIVQTAASAVNTSNSGVIFTVPVLLLMGYTLNAEAPDFWLITAACIAGGVLGTAFIIPLRKQMIDIDRLRFPSGTGVAVVLKSPGAGAKKSIVLVAGLVFGALVYLPVALPGIRSAARVERLDHLVAHEKISREAAATTRAIEAWIADRSAPADVIARGQVVAELDAARAALGAASDCAVQRGLHDDIEAIDHRLAETTIAGDVAVSNGLARQAYRAQNNIDGVTWESLRTMDLGWAAEPMFGYSDLNLRFAATPDPSQPAADLDGDGAPDQPLLARIDGNNNGRPDLILTDETLDAGRLFGLPPEFFLVFAISPLSLGAGFITGRPGLMVLAGGILAYLFLNPVLFNLGWLPESVTGHGVGAYGMRHLNRPLGIGLLLGGAMMGVAAALPAIGAALKSVSAASKLKSGRSEELGLKIVALSAAGALLLLFFTSSTLGTRPINTVCPITSEPVCTDAPTESFQGYAIAFADESAAARWEAEWTDAQRKEFLLDHGAKPGWLAGMPPLVRSIIIAVIGGFWIWFAGIIIAQCTGMTDWSPISGMALLTVVLVMMLAGSGAVVGSVLIGAALCVAVTLAADMMSDLRTGHLVGAIPRRQQIAELVVVPIGPAITMLVILIIASVNMKTYGVPMGEGTPTTAPQALALQAVITGVQGGELPYALYGLGAILGILLGLGSFAGLGVLVGLSMYLPFEYIATYGIGCVLQMVLTKAKGARWCEEWGVPFCAGLIVGESILALIINLIVLASG